MATQAYTQPKGAVGTPGALQMSQNTIPQNSYTGLKGRFGGMTDQVFNKFKGFGTGGAGSAGGGFGFNFGYPGPDDPITGGYLKNLRGGSANMVNDAVNRMAYAGPSRAGTGVVGGPDARSALSTQAVSQIARLFPQMYGQAMEYGKDFYGAGADYQKSLMSMIPSMMGQELGAAQGEGNFDLSVYGTRDAAAQRALDYERQQQALKNQYAREDVLDTRNYERGAPARNQQALDWMHQNQDWTSKFQGNQAATQKKASMENEYRGILENYPGYRAKFGSGAGFAPEALQEYMRTQLGIDEPIKRSVAVNWSPGSGSINYGK